MTYDPVSRSIAANTNNMQYLMDDQIQTTKELSSNVAKFNELVDLYRVESDNSNKKMVWLTVAIVILTILMLIGLFIQIYLAIIVK